MKRRQFFAVPAALALAACATNGAPSQTPAQVIADLQVIASALANDLVVLGILPGGTRTTINAAVATIAVIASKVAKLHFPYPAPRGRIEDVS